MAITDIESPGAGLGFADAANEAPPTAPKQRVRPRKSSLKIENEKIVQRVIGFFDDDTTNRAMDIDARLQRYAKFRMWTEGKDWPWEDCSDAAIPDMMTHSLKVQDTLNNAVMSRRPAILSKAIKKADKGKQESVDDLLDYQFFSENPGELIAGEMADAFVNDGVVTVFIPWVKEDREVHQIHTLPQIPLTDNPEMYFSRFLESIYPKKIVKKRGKEGWSWEILDDDGKTWFPVEFYTVGNEIEMDAQKKTTVFNGPRPIVKDYEDVLHPARAANLQIPSPSNPGGAAHVILVDYPTVDEVKRLKASGFYDLIDDEDLKKLEVAQKDDATGQTMKQQADVFQGQQDTPSSNDGEGEGKSQDHKTLTRLMCFDIYDSDGDGVNEDMIWWVLKEPNLLLRARELTQVYPADPPRRPFAEATFLPVRGRRTGISLLEMMEGLHDLIKQFFDQTADRATLTGVPFGFYRATGNMRPEVLRMWPGELYPLADPKNDVVFPQMPQGSTDSMNLMAMLGQFEERLTNIGDLQLGRVPQGKASALRTVRGMQSVLGQGDARPERLLRRYFIGLKEVYAQMHELNQAFLPRDKQYRVCGVKQPNEDPYRKLDDPAQIRGRFQFDFDANAMNTSKEAMQSALDELLSMYLNPIALQLGITKPDGAYQLLRDAGKARGQDPDKYITPPTPDANLPKMFAEEVITLIMAGNLPECRPAEPNAMDHMGKLMEFAGRDEFGYLTPAQVQIFKGYLSMLRQRMQAQAQEQALMQAAAQFQQSRGGGGVPGPEGTAPLDTAQAPLQRNELMDETLPGAGGGGNPTTIQ